MFEIDAGLSRNVSKSYRSILLEGGAETDCSTDNDESAKNSDR